MQDQLDRYAILFRQHRAEVESFLDDARISVYGKRGLQDLVREHRSAWHLGTVPVDVIVGLLLRESRLAIIDLQSERYRPEQRYAWGTPSAFHLALSLRPNAYLSHGTAAYLHGLQGDVPATFFVNKEQAAKAQAGKLTQEALDRAFAARPRQSNLVYADKEGRRFVVIAGKHSARLEVGQVPGPAGELLEATRPERTLVDIAVRPVYAGGVHKVLEAYRAARERISVNVLMATLKKLGHLYPYHQAIGFYLERAGYDARALDLARRPGLEFDFYLAHGMKDTEFSRDWRLTYPRGL
jgi:hypothetical protein